MHRFPRRNAQSQIKQIGSGAHFGGVLCEASDIALDEHEILRRIIGGRRILASIAKPYLVNHHARIRRNRSVHASEQDEGAHRLAIGVRGQRRSPLIVFAARNIDKAADRRGQFQLSDLTTEGNRPEHGAAIRVDCQRRALQIVVLRKEEKVARRFRGNCAGCRDKDLAVCAARLSGSLGAHFEAHRQRPIGRARRTGRQQERRRQQQAQ